MSITYTVGGDALFNCNRPNVAGQTFHIREEHVLEYIDLNLRGSMTTCKPVVQLFHAGADFKPWGPTLSRDVTVIESDATLFHTGRVRFKMQSVLLYAGSTYFIWVSSFPGPLQPGVSWEYDTDDAIKPPGHRVSSDDGGDTWTVHYGSAHIFTEFGNPPLPDPMPPPLINKWAAIGITLRHFENALAISLSTSVPCHLTCYYTHIQPLKHYSSRIVRGIKVPWHTIFSFAGWKATEQTQLGDTLYHTFLIYDWFYDQRRWFTFRGKVDYDDVPSVGPIFDHTHPSQDIIKNPWFNDWRHPLDPPKYWAIGTRLGSEEHPVPDYHIWKVAQVSPRTHIDIFGQATIIIQSLDITALEGLKVKISAQVRGHLAFDNGIVIGVKDTDWYWYADNLTQHYDWELLSQTITLPDDLTGLQVYSRIRYDWPMPDMYQWVDDWKLELL